MKREVGIVDLHPHGIGDLGMITVEGVLLQGADHQDGGAFHVAVVGPFLEIVGGRDLYPEIEIISRLAHFLDQEADPGQMRENNMNAFNTVQMTLERMFFFVFDMLFKLFFIRCSCIVSCNK